MLHFGYSLTCKLMNRNTYQGLLPPEIAADSLWPQISALLERALPYSRGEYTLDDIRQALSKRDMLAVARIEGGKVEFVVTCSLVVYPRKRVLYIQYGAGEGGNDLHETVHQLAKNLRCDWVETRTRSSVARLYRRAGYDIGYCVPILEVQ